MTDFALVLVAGAALYLLLRGAASLADVGLIAAVSMLAGFLGGIVLGRTIANALLCGVIFGVTAASTTLASKPRVAIWHEA